MSNRIRKGNTFVIVANIAEHNEIYAVCQATRTLDIDELKREYFDTHPQQSWNHSFNAGDFFSWLLTEKKAAKKISTIMWNLGNYGKADFSLTA
jgi:hypothetical protein